VDVGSGRPPETPRFARSALDVIDTGRARSAGEGSQITDPVDSIADGLLAKPRVGLGFGCPLVLPVPEAWVALARARQGEGNRPWSASAGVSARGTGLVHWEAGTTTSSFVNGPGRSKYSDGSLFLISESYRLLGLEQ
jgi:hypothetical protein